VLGTRIMPEEWHEDWDARYQEAASAFEDRDARLDALADEAERELEVIGVTAIEDKLQVFTPMCVGVVGSGVGAWVDWGTA
jgi:hypothetical protein